MQWLQWLFDWPKSGEDSLEKRVQRLADLHVTVGYEVAEIKALLHAGRMFDMTPDQQALLTIEEQIIMLAREQKDLARQVAELKAILIAQPEGSG
jgi:hypothetical protein